MGITTIFRPLEIPPGPDRDAVIEGQLRDQRIVRAFHEAANRELGDLEERRFAIARAIAWDVIDAILFRAPSSSA